MTDKVPLPSNHEAELAKTQAVLIERQSKLISAQQETIERLNTIVKALSASARKLGYHCPDCKREVVFGDSRCVVTGEQHAPAISQVETPRVIAPEAGAISAVINEMISVAAREDVDNLPDWTADNRAQIDRWQARLQDAIRQEETSAQRLCLGCGKPYPCASDCPAGTASPTTSVTK